jgi:ribosomal protein L20A (L18A)
MSETKRFRVSGEIVKAKLFAPMKFTKEVEATNLSHAKERVYADLGSRHRAKRYEIKILKVEEVGSNEVLSKRGER